MNFNDFFQSLSLELSMSVKFHLLNKKEIISNNKSIIFLKTGIMRSEYDGVIIKIYRENQFLNLNVLSSNHNKSSVDFIASKDCEIILFNIDSFKDELKKNNLLFNLFIEAISEEQCQLIERIYSLNSNNVKQKVMRSLYFDSVNSENDNHFRSGDWANYIGTTKENIVRTFSSLRKENIINKKASFYNPFYVNKSKLELI